MGSVVRPRFGTGSYMLGYFHLCTSIFKSKQSLVCNSTNCKLNDSINIQTEKRKKACNCHTLEHIKAHITVNEAEDKTTDGYIVLTN